jgi:signal transduction histidine kinase
VLQVRDNGVGIAIDAANKLTSHGIRGMRERALQFGGEVVLARETDGGTTLVATIAHR